ncbi:MAG TPA: class I SAM-dependent RNA methyltransferase [Pyrinomonadaceae bacterium]|jgi:23S rRNA (uracil1939-C5)-methyltransferase|nr:class I SAM-dependent RNA methyltransferase [Pyrinomonadaceae bacterium]
MKVAEEVEKTLDVEIERLLPGGVGLAHAEGLTLFVSLAAPGDVLQVKIDRIQGKVGFASIVKIIKPSAVRIEAPCPYFGRCGGCDFQQLNYETQLEAKAEIIHDCLRRIAQVELPGRIQVMPSPKQWHYRIRANWQVETTTKQLGYFERGSNRICDVDYCAVLAPELQQALERVRHEIKDGNGSNGPRTIDVVVGDDGVSMAPASAGFNPGVINRRIGSENYNFNAESFFQVNNELVEPLIAEALGDVGGQFAVDLYCGVGLFTLPLARRFARVTAVEQYAPATEFARRNLAEAKLENVELVTLDVADWLKHSRPFEPLDFLLLDPPRVGCENAAIAGILALRPQRIAYVSCDPATLARDLKKLIANGYSLDSVAAFDMFPQTHHVETVTRLTANRQP